MQFIKRLCGGGGETHSLKSKFLTLAYWKIASNYREIIWENWEIVFSVYNHNNESNENE